MLFNEADQYCSPRNVTKAMLHISTDRDQLNK